MLGLALLVFSQANSIRADDGKTQSQEVQTLAAEYLECAVLVFASQNLFSRQEDKISAMMNASKLASRWQGFLLLSEEQASKILISRIEEVKELVDSKESFEENYNSAQQHLCADFVKKELWG